MHSVLNEEGNLLTIISKLFDIDGNKEKKKVNDSYLKGSISKFSKNLIMSFPLLCDAGIPVDTAMMVSKANERNIVNMLQLIFMSLNLQAENGAGGSEIIASLYKDLDPNMSYNDVMDLLDKLAGGDGEYSNIAKDLNEAAIIREMMNQFKAQKPFRKESLNEKSIADFSVKTIHGKIMVNEAIGGPTSYQAASLNQRGQEFQYKIDFDEKKKREDANKEAKIDIKQVFDQKAAKKANDLEPTMIIVNYNSVSKDNNGISNLIDRKSFLAGVKSRAIPVDSTDLIERFVSKDRTKLSLKNLIRATTGEISLVKDFILCLDKLKIDAKNSAKQGALAQYWNILEKRSIKNNVNKLKRKGNDGSAITTICVSMESVNFMKNAYRFDLLNITNAKMIMDSYNLLGLIITDESTESIKVLYDGYNEFEVVSYASLDRDLTERNYKKVVNLLNSQDRR